MKRGGCHMHLTEQYWMYRLAYNLVKEEKYEALHMNHHRNELWLEKQDRKTTQIIRFIHHGFDWKNHLKSDIAQVFQRVKKMKKLFIGKTINISNVYVSEYEPVDDWDSLKKPMILKEKKPLRMNVFYLTEENYMEEEIRLYNQINLTSYNHEQVPNETTQENDLSFYKAKLNEILHHKHKEYESIFTYGKPRFTYIFILLNILMFIILELSGGSTNIETLIQNGAKYNPAIMDGEWWRLVTSIFLHIGTLHLVMNMIALYYLGIIVERIYGSGRFLVIYFLSGIGGSLTSFAFNVNISAGASGALFGLFGALLFFGLIHKRLFQQTLGKNIIFILIINLVIGIFIPQIDMGAHLGGLIGGFLASVITYLPKKKHPLLQSAATVIFLFILIGLFSYGLWANMNYLN